MNVISLQTWWKLHYEMMKLNYFDYFLYLTLDLPLHVLQYRSIFSKSTFQSLSSVSSSWPPAPRLSPEPENKSNFSCNNSEAVTQMQIFSVDLFNLLLRKFKWRNSFLSLIFSVEWTSAVTLHWYRIIIHLRMKISKSFSLNYHSHLLSVYVPPQHLCFLNVSV